MSATETALHALVAHYLDTGRVFELGEIERALRRGRPLKERAQLMIAFAKARVARPAFRKRFGLPAKTL